MDLRFFVKQCVLNLLGIVTCHRVVVRSLQLQGAPIALHYRTKRFALFFAGMLGARILLGKIWEVTFRRIRRHVMPGASSDDVLLVSAMVVRPFRSTHHWLLVTGVLWSSSHPQLADAFWRSKMLWLSTVWSQGTPIATRAQVAVFFLISGMLASQIVATLTPQPGRGITAAIAHVIKMPLGMTFSAIECFMIDDPFAFSIHRDGSEGGVSWTSDEPGAQWSLSRFNIFDAIVKMASRLVPAAAAAAGFAVAEGEAVSPGLAFIAIVRTVVYESWQPMILHAICSCML